MKKRVVALLLALVLLAGCGGTAPAPDLARTGAYAETDITPPLAKDECIGLFLQPDGTLHYLTRAEQTVGWFTLDTTDPAARWQQRPDSRPPEAEDAYPDACLTAEGELYWRTARWDEDAFAVADTFYRTEDGAAVPVDESLVPAEARVYFQRGAGGFARCGKDAETLLYRDLNGVLRACDRGGVEQALDLPQPDGGVLLGGAEDAWYLIDNNKVLRYIPGGTTAEVLTDLTYYTPGALGSRCAASAAGPDATLYLALRSSGGNALYRYAWDENAQLPQREKLTVFSLYYLDTVNTAVGALQQSTGASVTYSYAMNAIDWNNKLTDAQAGTVRADALRQLNTQLLAGQGPDVLILDDMDIDALRRNGLLADLSGLVSAETVDGLFTGMANAWRDADGLWALPGRCFPWLLAGAPEDIEGIGTLEDFVRYIEAGPRGPHSFEELGTTQTLCGFNGWYSLFETFYLLYEPDIWAGNALNADVYSEFLTLTGRIAAHQGSVWLEDRDASFGDTAKFGYPSVGMGAGAYGGSAGTGVDCYQPDTTFGIFQPFTSRATIAAHPEWLGEGSATPEELREPGRYVGLPRGDGGTAAKVTCVAGLNANCPAETLPLAVRLIETLLSEEVQTTYYYQNDGLPTNRAAMAARYESDLALAQKEFDGGITAEGDILAVLDAMQAVLPRRELAKAAWYGAWEYYNSGDLTAALDAANDAAALWLAEQ